MESGLLRTRMHDDRAGSTWNDRASSSRRRAIDRLRAVLQTGPTGLVLVTGEPGSGKTWLVEQVLAQLDAGARTVRAALSRSLDEAGVLYLIGHGLGVDAPLAIGPARRALEQTLEEESADGRGWLLVIEDVDRASETVADALRALADQLGKPAGFAGIVLTGSTGTIRFLADRSRRRLGSMVAHHLHLGPLDFDEAVELLAPGRELDRETRARLQRLHRDARGNARALRLLDAENPIFQRHPAVSETPSDPRAIAATRRVESDAGSETQRIERAAVPASLAVDQVEPFLPSRPPIRVEEGLVEVGWEGEIEDDGDAQSIESEPLSTPTPARLEPARVVSREEPVEDQYAAIQAWTEWARNREFAASNRPTIQTKPLEPEGDASDQDELLAAIEGPDPGEAEVEPARPSRGSHRAESQHEFPPYSRLFGAPRRP